MIENENPVATEVAEKTEHTAEETTPKMFTQDEVNEMMSKRLARKEAKIRKEYDRKYGDLEEVLKAGTGKQTVEEMTDTFKQFYSRKGITIPDKPSYTDKEIVVLARAEADDIIGGGYEEVVEEMDRLAGIGVEHMTAKEKAVFKTLADFRANSERGAELSKIGVTEDVYNSSEFKAFSSKFNPNTPISEIYDIYAKTQPKKEIKTMGSMKNVNPGSAVKEFYTPEEAKKFTVKELNNNPALFKAIEESMRKWK